jgi:hypothetical protein
MFFVAKLLNNSRIIAHFCYVPNILGLISQNGNVTLQISAYPTRHINKTWNCSDIHLKRQKVQTVVEIYEGFCLQS